MRSEEEIRTDAADERPFSNGTEWGIWADRFCYECVHDDANREIYCPIITVAMIGNTGSPMWPKEWLRERVPWTDRDGVEHSYERVDACTEFEERRDPGDDDPPPPEPVPDCDGQLDLIDAYLDTAIEELAPRTVRA